MRRLATVGVAAMVYVLAAWSVAPGFYDGFTPQQPYNWVCPPLHVSGNIAPLPGHVDIAVIGGVSDASSAFTDDGQVVVGFLPGAFDVTGKTQVSVDVTPVSPCPSHPGLTFVTNAYHFTADAPLVKPVNSFLMRFSDLVPAPSDIYFATSPDGPWKSLGGHDGQPFTFVVSTQQYGYYAAGYPAGAVTGRSTTSQLLPIAVAVLIIGVLVAGIPLAVIRRRRGPAGPEAGPERKEEEPEATRP
jgi:hypothetical protein